VLCVDNCHKVPLQTKSAFLQLPLSANDVRSNFGIEVLHQNLAKILILLFLRNTAFCVVNEMGSGICSSGFASVRRCWLMLEIRWHMHGLAPFYIRSEGFDLLMLRSIQPMSRLFSLG